MNPAPPPPAFDRAAAEYDARFTERLLGRWLRSAVWRRAAASFRPGDHVLELGCGTGEDAVWLARRGVTVTATDASPGMLEQARRKAAASGAGHRIAFAPFDFAADPAGGGPDRVAVEGAAPFDGALADFGALNCLPDRRALAGMLAEWLRPGARVVLVLMGPFCLWETAWHLARGEPRRALRRLRAGGEANVGGGGSLPVWYPSPGRLRAELRPWFDHLETTAVGLLLPPSYLGGLVERWPRPFARLRVLEDRLAPRFPWPWLSDHYLAVFERR